MPFEKLLFDTLSQVLGELLGETLEQKLDRRRLHRALAAAVARAEQRFAQEYRAHDAELADALTTQTRFADLPSVRAALRELLTRPFHDPSQPIATLQQSFDDVLPEHLDRARVDAAVQAFLGYLGQETLDISELRELYGLLFQKLSAESSLSMAADTAVLVQGVHDLRDDLRQIAAAPAHAALPAAAPAERPHPWHNLPQRSYARFVGRQAELEQLTRLLLPHPRSRHFVVTLDGIGGVGKSALALELAYRYREGYFTLPSDERFDALVWISAKRTLLTASGIQTRQQTFTTLSDLYRQIALTLEQPDIVQHDAAQQRSRVERALAQQRTLLIVDNLETVDDEELLAFLRELPDPTKAIVTTRHRIDIAYAIRLSGMPQADAQALMLVEAARKGVDLPITALDDLYRRSGGVPLAIVWSIGLMSLGHRVEAVLRRLGSARSDIARFCFDESVARIRDRDAYWLLLALALFESHVGRPMLGAVAGLGDDALGRDDGLAELLQLSLVEQKGDRFFLLPLTQSYALEELARQPEWERELRERWVGALLTFAQPYQQIYHLQPNPAALWREGPHLVRLAHWTDQTEQPDLFLAILPALLCYTDTTGSWSDLLHYAHQGLDYAQLLGQGQALRRIYVGQAWVLSQRGEHHDAEHALNDALALMRRAGDVEGEIELLGRLGQVQRRRGDLVRASATYQQALDRLVTLPANLVAYNRADLMHELGKLARDQGDWAVAHARFLEAQAVFSLGEEHPAYNPEQAWGILGNIGYVLQQLGKADEAAELYRRSLAFFREAGGRGYMTTLLTRLAALEAQRGNPAAALGYAREALEWSRKLGMVREQAQAEVLVERLTTDQQ